MTKLSYNLILLKLELQKSIFSQLLFTDQEPVFKLF